MKRYIFLLAVITAFCLSLTSCQKDFTIDDVDPPIDSTDTVRDSIYIDKIYTLWDMGTGMDTVGVTIFNYDALKRVVSIADSDYPLTSYTIVQRYEYNGNDTIPSKKIDYEPADSLVSYFTYDAQQRILKDSSILFDNILGVPESTIVVVNYSYATGFIYGQTARIYSDPASGTEYYRDTATINSFGDIVNSKQYMLNAATSIYELYSTSAFTYGTNTGIFANSSIFKANQIFPSGETLLTEYMTHKNMLSQNETMISTSSNYNITYTYVYNPRGLVTKFSYTDGGGDPEEVLFTYKSL